MTRGNPWVLSGAVLVVGGFCMGWVGLRGLGGGLFVDGWGVLGFLRERSSAYWLLYALPVGAIAAGVAALFDRRAAATLALVVGLGLLAWSAFEVARIVWNTTFAGLWLTWAGALVLTLAGLGTRRRA